MEDQTPIVSYKDQYDDLLYPNLIDSSPLWSDNNCAPPFNSSIFEGVPTIIYDDCAASSAVADINDHHHGLHVGTDDTFLDVDLEVGNSGYHETSGEVGRGDGEMWLVWEIEFALDEFPLRVWSVTQRPESCSQCQVLREIVHVNSAHTARLEIHGSIGLISHGILVNDHSINLEQMGNSREHQFFDFHDRHMEAVKKFLKWYLRKRTDDGYILQQHDNPTVAFLEALCVGLDFHNDTRYHDHALGTDVQERGPPRDHLDVGGDQVNQTAFDISEVVMSEAIFAPMMHHQAVIEGDDQAAIPYFDRVTGEGLQVDETVLPSASNLSGSGDRVYRGDEEAVNQGAETLHCDANQHGSVHDHPTGNPPMLNENNVPPAEDDAAAAARTQLSLKRERAARLTLAEISVYFHLPIVKASVELDLCVTSIKRKLRGFGIPRWPYRKVASLTKKIDKYENDLGSDDEAKRALAQLEIPRLRLELANVYRANADVIG